MQNKLTKSAYAKINLTLDVISKRDDGYHDIISIMQSISLCDDISMEKTDVAGKIAVSWDLPIRCNDKNTAYKAAKLMFTEYKLKGGIAIRMIKRIPICAGLGGGSSDAAAVIEGIDELYQLNIAPQKLLQLGAIIGADVPFCIMKGTAIAEGIGEKLVPINAKINCFVVVVKPNISVSTKDVYSKIDNVILARRPDTNLAISAMKGSDLKNLGQNLYNVMEYVTIDEYPIIKTIKDKLVVQGASGALMSGSGSSVYGIFENKILAVNAYNFFKCKYKIFDTFMCEFYYPKN